MRRRSLLRTVPPLALAGLAGCSAPGVGRPDLQMEGGRATIHPASDLYVANGLHADGSDRVYAVAVADESPDTVGPDASDVVAEPLRTDDGDCFHLVMQLRSSPAAPMMLRPEHAVPVEWPSRSKLRLRVTVEPWGVLDDIDDEAERERLRAADELVYTSVWTYAPGLESLPESVELVLASRG